MLKALRVGLIDLDEFLNILSEMIRQGFRLKEEVVVEAIKEDRRLGKIKIQVKILNSI